VLVSASQVAVRVPSHLPVQRGEQTAASLAGITQFPTSLSLKGGAVRHCSAVFKEHDPLFVHTPELQVELRDPLYPELHIGIQVVPEAEGITQFPLPAFEMAKAAVHCAPVLITQLPVFDQVPELQVALRVPEYPVLH